jgi:hypothetical protein
MQLPPGFTLPDVFEAALATGLVTRKKSALLLEATTGCSTLAGYIDAMLGYFAAPGKPSRRLSRIAEQVRQVYSLDDSPPLWSFAWLDVIVREEIAEAAREQVDPWGADRLELEFAAMRDRRVVEVMEVHRGRSGADELRLAKSKRKRGSERKGKGKTG